MVALERLPSPSEMIAHLDRHVAGQERAKKLLATAVYQHYLGLAVRDLPGKAGPDFGRQHVLMLGPTGCGKTLLVRTLAKLLGVPVAFIAALDPDLVICEVQGDHPVTGTDRRYQNQYLMLMEFRDGKVVRWRELSNPKEYERAVLGR